jgi:hypothetical protein
MKPYLTPRAVVVHGKSLPRSKLRTPRSHQNFILSSSDASSVVHSRAYTTILGSSPSGSMPLNGSYDKRETNHQVEMKRRIFYKAKSMCFRIVDTKINWNPALLYPCAQTWLLSKLHSVKIYFWWISQSWCVQLGRYLSGPSHALRRRNKRPILICENTKKSPT